MFAGASVATAEPNDQTEALGRFLGGGLAALDFGPFPELRGAHAAYPSGPGLETAVIDAEVLDAFNARLGIELLGDNGIVALGAVNQYAAADAGGAHAASGAVNDGGAIEIGGSDEFPANGWIDVTPVLDDPLGDIVEGFYLELGAMSGTAEWPVGGEPTGDYQIASASLELDSPAVGNITTLVNDEVVPVIDDAVSSLLGTDGELADALNALDALDPVLTVLGADLEPTVTLDVDIPAALAPVLADSFGDEGVIIDLADGTVSIDLDTILGEGSLNDLPPNTELLTDEAVAAIAAGLAAALDDLTTELVGAVETALRAATLTLSVEASVLGLPPLPATMLDLDIDLEATLGDIVAGDVEPDQATIAITVAGLPLDLPLDDLVDALAGPLNAVLFGETGLVGTLAGTVSTEVLTPTLDTLSPVLESLDDVLSIVVNVQQRPGDLPAHDPSGTESFTQRALTVTLLPGETPLAQFELASATVRATEVDGTEVDGTEVDGTEVDGTEVDGTEVDGTEVDGDDPDRELASEFAKPRVMRGAEQTFTAWGFEPGERVQAVINSEPLTLPVRTADAEGRVSWTFVVPADFEVGPHTGTATSVDVGDSTTAAFTVYVMASSGSGGGSTGGGTTGGGGAGDGGMLPRTGAEIMASLAMALLLIGTGTAAVVGVNRRTRSAKG